MEDDAFAKGWDYSRLAGEANVSVGAISKFLRGISTSPKMAQRIADALEQPLDRYHKRSAEAAA